MSIFTRENSSHPAQIFLNEALYVKLPIQKLDFFFAGTSLSLLLDTVGKSGSSFAGIFFFQHRNKTKATNFTKHETETFLLDTLSHKCLKTLDFIILS